MQRHGIPLTKPALPSTAGSEEFSLQSLPVNVSSKPHSTTERSQLADHAVANLLSTIYRGWFAEDKERTSRLSRPAKSDPSIGPSTLPDSFTKQPLTQASHSSAPRSAEPKHIPKKLQKRAKPVQYPSTKKRFLDCLYF